MIPFQPVQEAGFFRIQLLSGCLLAFPWLWRGQVNITGFCCLTYRKQKEMGVVCELLPLVIK